MNIGNLKPDAQTNAPVGRIATMNFTALIALQEVRSNNPRAPAYDVLALSSDRRTWLKIGALWEFSATGTGESFYSGRIDDPSMAKPLDIAVFRQEDESFNVAWRRPKQRVDTPKPGTAPAEDALPALPGSDGTDSGDGIPEGTPVHRGGEEGDGLGESTAPAPSGRRRARETADA
jgi:uncharacterized protein (DUF736 family)